jgi:hypothetical protein
MHQQYRNQGLYMLGHHFTNPPEPGKEEGTGGIGVEPGFDRDADPDADREIQGLQDLCRSLEQRCGPTTGTKTTWW